MIGYDEKAKEEVENKDKLANCKITRNEFWHLFLPKFNEKSNLFAGRNIELNQYDHWFSTGSGTQEENKKIHDYFYTNKDEIETAFGKEMEWERLDDKKMSRISSKLHGVSIYNKEDWNEMMEFLTEAMIKFEKALRKYINNYSRNIKK